MPCLRGLADVLLRRGKPGEADPPLARALTLAEQGEDAGELASVLNGAGALRLRQGRLDEGARRARAVAWARGRGRPGPRSETLTRLGDVLAAQGKRAPTRSRSTARP